MTTLYTPGCSQYQPNSGALVTLNSQIVVGNCTANNVSGRPQDPPYDFACLKIGNTGTQTCINLATGASGTSPNSICCQSPATITQFPASQPAIYYYPNPTVIYPSHVIPSSNPACQFSGVNDCARYLDSLPGAGPITSASHFRNMTRCRQMCPRYQ